MISKTKIKWINSLERKKNRDEEGVFVAEGRKIISELLSLMKCRLLVYCDSQLMQSLPTLPDEIEEISAQDYQKISFQKSPQGVLAVFEKPSYALNKDNICSNLTLALDSIQDPGNLGTIIRQADWFGINNVLCSPTTADIFSPKSIQATMGAIARVRVHYVELSSFLQTVNKETPVYGTFMDGDNIYTSTLTRNGVIIMGNEGNGISNDLLPLITRKLTIPCFPPDAQTSESLNVGAATSIVLSEFRRRASTP